MIIIIHWVLTLPLLRVSQVFRQSDPMFLKGEISGGKATFNQRELLYPTSSWNWTNAQSPWKLLCEKRQEDTVTGGGAGRAQETEIWKQRLGRRHLSGERKTYMRRAKTAQIEETSVGPSPALVLAQGWPVRTFTRSRYILLGIPPSCHPTKEDSFPLYPNGHFCYPTVLCQTESCRRKRRKKKKT